MSVIPRPDRPVENRLLAGGHIKILDRSKLEKTVCECYRVVKDEFDRLLG